MELEDAYLDRMRETIDAPADAVATTLIEQGAAGLVKDLMRQRKMWDDDGEPSRLLPEDIRAYMKAASALPPWCDRAKIDEAQQFFLLYGLASSTLLACASLPQCYVMKYGTEVLAYTKFLQVEPTRRIRETAQMVMDVMVPGGLQPGGRGVRATMRVRVMHAIVRHMVMNDPRAVANPSDPELRAKFGLPINQEDMVYTLMTFSYVVIEGFRIMGYDMTEAQRDGYVHCWNVVGHLMGIRDELLPARFDDAAELFAVIQRRQCGQSAGGSEADQGADRRRRGRPAGRPPRPVDRRAHAPARRGRDRRCAGDPAADAGAEASPRCDARGVGGVSACRHTAARGPALPLCLRGASSRHHGQDGRHGRRGVRSPARVRRTLVSRRPAGTCRRLKT